jgi:hypothetical protein
MYTCHLQFFNNKILYPHPNPAAPHRPHLNPTPTSLHLALTVSQCPNRFPSSPPAPHHPHAVSAISTLAHAGVKAALAKAGAVAFAAPTRPSHAELMHWIRNPRRCGGAVPRQFIVVPRHFLGNIRRDSCCYSIPRPQRYFLIYFHSLANNRTSVNFFY